MTFKPIIPPPPKSAEQIAADAATAALKREWNAPYVPPGERAFAVPKKPAEEMTRAELAGAWANVARRRVPPAK